MDQKNSLQCMKRKKTPQFKHFLKTLNYSSQLKIRSRNVKWVDLYTSIYAIYNIYYMSETI